MRSLYVQNLRRIFGFKSIFYLLKMILLILRRQMTDKNDLYATFALHLFKRRT